MRAIAASWVIPGGVDDAPIARGAVVLDDGGCVAAVGERDALRKRYAQARWEEHAAVLLPGLVNAHTHLELSALRGRVPGGHGFTAWVDAMLHARDTSAPDQDGDAIDAAVSELLDAGTVAVGEVSNTLAAVDSLARAPLLGWVFHEVYGLRRESGEAMLVLADQRRAELRAWPDNLRYAPAPHTPYTLHPDVLQQVVGRARALGERTSLHLCEHPAERAFLAHGGGPFAAFLSARGSTPVDWLAPGLDPVRYVQRLGALGPDVLCVHVTDARADEIAVLAAAGARVVLCPRSNLHIEVVLPPLLQLLAAGVRPALGTDSLASSPSLDVLDEARALLARFPGVSPRVLLAMATSFGAEALGLAQRVGRLAPGLDPGVIAFEHAGAAPSDPERFVLSHAPLRRRVLSRPSLSGELSLTTTGAA
jgi:cytosine/adenosine deaminase-related metal-dependent hydrolase